MIEQGISLSKLGENVFVKIPITFTNGKSTKKVIEALQGDEKPLKFKISEDFNV